MPKRTPQISIIKLHRYL